MFRYAACTALLLASFASPAGAVPFIISLGAPGWGTAVSADGSVAVGSMGNAEAFRWTSATGMVGLGDIPGGSAESQAFGVSADGSVVVGHSSSASGLEAFRWTQGGGMVGLGDLPGGIYESVAANTSADGSVVVGNGRSASGGEAFRWTGGGGMVGLGDLPGGFFGSSAAAVSDDGSSVVGRAFSSAGAEAYLWTASGGMVGLGDLAGGSFGSRATGISADGAIVVGTGTSAAGPEAFLWTASGGMVSLGSLGFFSVNPTTVSSDGSRVVGYLVGEGGDGTAFIWDAANGMRLLRDALVNDYGLDLSGWLHLETAAISDDGRSIVGTGIRKSSGAYEPYLAFLPEPAPTTLLTVGMLAALLALGPRATASSGRRGSGGGCAPK